MNFRQFNFLLLFFILSFYPSPVFSDFAERPKPDGRLNPGEPVELRIVSPEMDQILEDERVEVQFELVNFEAEPGGPHLHFILDNQPVQEHFQTDKPFILPSVSRGTHVLAAFPVTSWHESWKDKDALAIVLFHVKEKTPNYPVDLSKPLLIFNMPQGSLEPYKDRWIVFDFLFSNVKQKSEDTRIENYRVRYRLDGTTSVTDYWEPRFWLNLNHGSHEIEMELLDSHNRPFPNGSWNRVKRAFSVN